MTWWAWLLLGWLAAQPVFAIAWHRFVTWQKGGTP